MLARLLFVATALLAAACGGGVNLAPEPFTRERADGKIPVKTELIRQQVKRELAGMPEGESEVLRWQAIETDYHACRLSAKGKKSKAEEAFADCMANRGYVYMYRLDAEQLHNDIEFEVEKEHDRRIAAEKKQQEEQAKKRRLMELDTALIDAVFAAKNDNPAEIKRLIDDGADVNTQMKDGSSLLHITGEYGQPTITRMLIKAGVYVDAKTKSGATALHAAATFGQTETALVLIKAGAYINAKDDRGLTPLHLAAAFGPTDIVLALVKAGADIEAKDKDGYTPLYAAIIKGQTDIIVALVKAGANVFARTDNGATPLDIAAQMHGKDSIIALFLHRAMEKSGGENRQQADKLLRELE